MGLTQRWLAVVALGAALPAMAADAQVN